MSLLKLGFSAIGKLLVVAALAGTFLVGMLGVIYLSLQGEEIKVPEITGKDFVESERELTALGLKIKKRADRFSAEKQNTVLEQLPKAGETVKTGQMILVVTSKVDPEGGEAPTTIKKIGQDEEDDTEKIEEMISDKPKKSNKANTNVNKKKADTKRDVIANKSDDNSNSAGGDNSNKKDSGTSGNSADKGNKNTTTNPGIKPSSSPAPAKPPGGGETRPRPTPKP